MTRAARADDRPRRRDRLRRRRPGSWADLPARRLIPSRRADARRRVDERHDAVLPLPARRRRSPVILNKAEVVAVERGQRAGARGRGAGGHRGPQAWPVECRRPRPARPSRTSTCRRTTARARLPEPRRPVPDPARRRPRAPGAQAEHHARGRGAGAPDVAGPAAGRGRQGRRGGAAPHRRDGAWWCARAGSARGAGRGADLGRHRAAPRTQRSPPPRAQALAAGPRGMDVRAQRRRARCGPWPSAAPMACMRRSRSPPARRPRPRLRRAGSTRPRAAGTAGGHRRALPDHDRDEAPPTCTCASGSPPMVRKDGDMQPLPGARRRSTPAEIERCSADHARAQPRGVRAAARHRLRLRDRRAWPASAATSSWTARARAPCSASSRSKILTAEQLGLSPEILQLCHLTKGLVLVTGPTGSGKSTTLCAMIDYINRNRTDHIITIEDPIEFVHENKKCLINQRAGGRAHRLVQGRAARGAARGSGHRPGRRDARPRDGRHRHRDRRDRAPRVRHAAHDDRAVDRRPHHRSVPGRPAGADPHHAVGDPARASSPDAVPEDRRRPRAGARGADRASRGRQPDPRGQDLPDPVDHADGQEARHGA